jgi:hypothetical protein
MGDEVEVIGADDDICVVVAESGGHTRRSHEVFDRS